MNFIIFLTLFIIYNNNKCSSSITPSAPLKILGPTFEAEGNFRHDYTYYRELKGYLKLHVISANWHDARLRCHLEGATLASPINYSLRQSMLTLLRYRCKGCTAIYTGIHDIFSSGDFLSIEGVPLSKMLYGWSQKLPVQTKNGDSCLTQRLDGEFDVADCSFTKLPYICYKMAPRQMNVTICGTTDQEYKLKSITGSCYKFHTVPRIWSRAYMTCVAEGAHLAIINSEAEAKVITEIFAEYPSSSLVGKFWKDVAFVGFHDWNEHGEWLTIHGDTLKEAGYDKFSPGQPDNSSTGEHCGSVFRNGHFNDLWCEKMHAFICEKSPNRFNYHINI